VQHHNVTLVTQLAVSYSSHNCMTHLAGEQMSQPSMMLCASNSYPLIYPQHSLVGPDQQFVIGTL